MTVTLTARLPADDLVFVQPGKTVKIVARTVATADEPDLYDVMLEIKPEPGAWVYLDTTDGSAA